MQTFETFYRGKLTLITQLINPTQLSYNFYIKKGSDKNTAYRYETSPKPDNMLSTGHRVESVKHAITTSAKDKDRVI